jgi:hypothetical protein
MNKITDKNKKEIKFNKNKLKKEKQAERQK